MKSDKEILKTVELEIKGNTIYLKFIENLEDIEENIRLSELMVEQIRSKIDESPGVVFNFIFDVLPIRMNATTPSITRKNYLSLAKDPQIGRIAVVGGNITVKTIVNFAMAATGKKGNMKLFDRRKEALEWINNG